MHRLFRYKPGNATPEPVLFGEKRSQDENEHEIVETRENIDHS
jgi:hypothetical protein